MSQRVLVSMAVAVGLVLGCAAQASAQMPVRVGGDIKEPRRTKDVKPVYPQIAQQANVQGIVILEIIIGEDGKVREARVLRPVPLLDQAALDAVLQWEYTPTLLNGQPVPLVMTVTVSFTLGGGQTAPREVAPDPLVMQRPSAFSDLLDTAKQYRERGLLNEAEATLQRALAALQAERAQNAAASAPVRVGATIKEPVKVKHVVPTFPPGTPAGVTVAEIIIGVDGRVTDVKVLRPTSADADAAAVAAIRQWVFAPTYLNGVAVPVIMTVTVTRH